MRKCGLKLAGAGYGRIRLKWPDTGAEITNTERV